MPAGRVAGKKGEGHGETEYQRQAARGGCRTRHVSALGDPRTGGAYRHQVRPRRGAVRRLFGTFQRRGVALLFPAGSGGLAGRQDRHHRGSLAEAVASGAEGLGGARCAAMRLLPVRPDQGRGGPVQEKARAVGQGHRRRDDQHLPQRHLPARVRRGASRRRNRRGAKKVARVNETTLAVVADTWWPAKTALDALPIRWNEGPNAKVSTASIAAAAIRITRARRWRRCR